MARQTPNRNTSTAPTIEELRGSITDAALASLSGTEAAKTISHRASSEKLLAAAIELLREQITLVRQLEFERDEAIDDIGALQNEIIAIRAMTAADIAPRPEQNREKASS